MRYNTFSCVYVTILSTKIIVYELRNTQVYYENYLYSQPFLEQEVNINLLPNWLANYKLANRGKFIFTDLRPCEAKSLKVTTSHHWMAINENFYVQVLHFA